MFVLDFKSHARTIFPFIIFGLLRAYIYSHLILGVHDKETVYQPLDYVSCFHPEIRDVTQNVFALDFESHAISIFFTHYLDYCTIETYPYVIYRAGYQKFKRVANTSWRSQLAKYLGCLRVNKQNIDSFIVAIHINSLFCCHLLGIDSNKRCKNTVLLVCFLSGTTELRGV